MEQKIAKTNDGHELHVNQYYYNSLGEQVFLLEVLVNQAGQTRYLVVPIFEGEAMDAKLYPSGHTEVTCPYIHEAEEVVIRAIYKDEPTPVLGEKTAKEIARLTRIAETIGDLIILENEIDTKLRKMYSVEEEKRKQLDEIDKQIEDKDKLLANKMAQLVEVKQKVSELEDSIGAATVADGAVTMELSELLMLRKMEHLVECLRAEGVDNWNGYEFAIERYRNRYPEE